MWDKHDRRGAYEPNSICIKIVLDVTQQMATGHPIRNQLEVIDSDTQQGQDVGVGQPFPHDSLLAEGL